MAAVFWSLRLGEFSLDVRAFDHNRVRNVTKILVSDFGTHALNKNGEMFSTAVCGSVRVYLSHDRRSLSLLDAAAKFGLLDPKRIRDLQDAHAKDRATRENYWAAKQVLEGAADLKINLPAKIRRRLTIARNAYKP